MKDNRLKVEIAQQPLSDLFYSCKSVCICRSIFSGKGGLILTRAYN